MRASLGVILLAVSCRAFAAPTVESVLAANRAAVGKMPAQGTLDLEYSLEASGLSGPATRIGDLATALLDASYETPIKTP